MYDTRRPEVRERLERERGELPDDGRKVTVVVDLPSSRLMPPPRRRREGEPMSDFAHRMLLEAVEAVAERRGVVLRDPERDFTRVRKVSLADLLAFLVFASEDTTGAELNDYFGWDGSAPSVSALTQLRKKLTPQAMPELLREFMSRFPVVPYLGVYRLLAVDGTGVGIARNADKRTEVTSNQYGLHRNEMHPTMVFDPIRRTFEDMVVQGSKVQDEQAAFCQLVDRFLCGRTAEGAELAGLWLADRNYTTYNTIAHLQEAGARFVLRCREDWAVRMLGDDLAEGDLDVTVERYLTRTRTTEGRSRPDEPGLYRVIDRDTRLDPLPRGPKGEPPEGEYRMVLRFVRVEITAAEDGDSKPKGKGKGKGKGKRWLTLVTNLTEEEGFDAQAVIDLYAVRWRQEVGIRFLKHTCGMKDPRCRDYDRAEQEIWGRLVLASACALAMSEVEEPKPGPKHERAVDVTMAFKAFLRILRGREDVDLDAICRRHTQSVRDDRHFERRKSKESRVRLCYRH